MNVKYPAMQSRKLLNIHKLLRIIASGLMRFA